MSYVASPAIEPCVWMAAGLVSYKLCDRDFDCSHCPLDVALRGGATATAGDDFGLGHRRHGEGFPDDRRYANSHLWVATGCRPGEPTVRIGLDSFAAALLPYPVRAVRLGGPRSLKRGEVICDIELREGTLSVRAPVSGEVECENPALAERPGLIVESPYRDGWLVDLMPSSDDTAFDEFVDADVARERTSQHLRRFRRRVARHLLKDAASVGPCMADGGEALTSLSEILGGAMYLRILREVLR
jgi:glycine cleavage system H lipoate-binding protein